ncbi:MAG TPA: glycerophosphoryl diester phosphodiesterase membrane domain-containing protein [Anaerolineales bacterium]|nr:glycerophosphoryl diester phosphodiesterase membrane domain-containing protein [Anaerolineales bacterium]
MEISTLPTLRPLGLGELLDQAIRLYRRNFLTFIGIIALVYVPVMILHTASTTLLSSSMLGFASSSPDEIFSNYAYWIGMFSTLGVAFIQFILVQGIATGALTRAVADNYLGSRTGILDAYRGIRGSWLKLVGALLFLGLVLIGVTIWWMVPCIGWFTGLGMLAFLMAAINPLVAPAVVLEGQNAIDAVRRAWSLARRRFWPLLGYVVILYLFSLLVVNGPVAIVSFALTGAFESINDPTTQLVVRSIVQSLVSLVGILIYYPLQMTAFTLIYLDLRVRTEGFDLALQTIDTSRSRNLTQAMAAPGLQSTERLITGQDLGNFAILTLAATGIYIFFFSFIMGSAFFFTSLIR